MGETTWIAHPVAQSPSSIDAQASSTWLRGAANARQELSRAMGRANVSVHGAAVDD